MIRTPLPARRRAALVVAACAAAVWVSAAGTGAVAQTAAEVSVNPNSGAPGSSFTITMKNYHQCAPDSPNCIIIDFLQPGKPATRIGTADSKGSPTFSGTVSVPPAAVAGAATVHAFSTTDDATTPFTVTNAPAPTTTTTIPGATTTTSTSTSTTTTTIAVTTTVSTVVLSPTTSVAPATTKKSSHSDVPRYIAVALVVLAAAATAAVDTRMRRLKPPAP